MAARAEIPPDHVTVLVASHRSYMDFLLCSYLFFSRPSLGVAIPHIAAADDFSRIPFLGRLFAKAQAFYIRRGQGQADPQLSGQVAELVEQGRTILFFIEGTRSRSRRHLSPKRGMLRALQETRRNVALLPIAITYDRLPEESALLNELQGHAKPPERLKSLLRWLWRALRKEVNLGRAHIACGDPVLLHPESDVADVALQVVASHQVAGVVTTFHLRRWLAHHSELGIDEAWLVEAFRSRGARIVESALDAEDLHPITDRCLVNHWIHHFYPEIHALLPDHPVIAHHLALFGYAPWHALPEPSDSKVLCVVRALFAPICEDYAKAAAMLAASPPPPEGLRLVELCRRIPEAFFPEVEAALDDFTQREMLVLDSGSYRIGPRFGELEAYGRSCRWPDETSFPPHLLSARS